MNSRERFNRALDGESVDHVPDFEFWFWDMTLERWADEGLPDHLVPSRRRGHGGLGDDTLREGLAKYFGFEYIRGIPIKTRFVREPEEEVIAEDEDTETVRTEIGEEMVRFKPGKGESIPTHTKYPIENREDWERIRDEFLPVDIQKRMPPDWDTLRAEYEARETILNTPAMGFYGILRNWMGVEQISISIALEPDWIEEMMEHLLAIYMAVAERIVADGIRVDVTGWWEDMCYSSGPLISPEMFDRFMVPRYKQVTDFYRRHGVRHGIVDSDGNVHKLAPLWLKGGVDIVFPCEVAHTDTVALRKENPLELWFRGGVDKRALAQGREAIDAELERIKPVLEIGHYMPHADHLIPPDVPLADYMYYRERKQKLIGK